MTAAEIYSCGKGRLNGVNLPMITKRITAKCHSRAKHGVQKAISLAFVLLCLTTAANAQEQTFKHENRFTIPAFLALQAADAWATDRGFNSGNWQEHNPLVSSDRSTRIVYFAGTAGAVILTGYILHKTNHHLMEKAVMHVAIGTEAYASAHSWAGQ